MKKNWFHNFCISSLDPTPDGQQSAWRWDCGTVPHRVGALSQPRGLWLGHSVENQRVAPAGVADVASPGISARAFSQRSWQEVEPPSLPERTEHRVGGPRSALAGPGQSVQQQQHDRPPELAAQVGQLVPGGGRVAAQLNA